MRLLWVAFGLRDPALDEGLSMLDQALAIQPDEASVQKAHETLDALATSNEDDDTASKKVACWCDDMRGFVAARIDEAQRETTRLGFEIKGKQAGNSVLSGDVEQHVRSRDEAQQGLDTAISIRERSRASYESEAADTEAAIAGVGDARDALAPSVAISFLQKQDPSQVDGVLQGLEDSFTDSLEAAKSREETEKTQFDDLHKAKSEVVKLEAQAARRKQERLADQKMQLVLDKALESAYSKRYDADAPLMQRVKAFCEAADEQAAARTAKRNEEQVAVSRAKADLSQGTAMRAAESLMHSSFVAAKKTLGTASEADAEALLASHSLQDLLEDGKARTEALTSALHAEWASSSHEENTLMSAGAGWATPVKAAVEAVGSLAKREFDALPERWAAIEQAAKASQIADMRVDVAEKDIKAGYSELQFSELQVGFAALAP